MKFLNSLLLLVASSVNVNGEGLTYTPNNDVTAHSKIGLDQIDIKDYIDNGDFDTALEIYINGLNREGKSLQAMAQKDWAEAEIEDLSDFESYAALFSVPGESATYLDSYTLDAMHCNGTFAGHTTTMCGIAAKKNLLCTGLGYAQYEGVKAIENLVEKNWDEMFAFYNGVYDMSVDSRMNSGGPGAVQISRDEEFSTSFREDAIQALIDGQKVISSDTVDTSKLEKAYKAFNKANLATFAQATLKYSSQFDEEGLEQAKADKKWGEGYTYFRCGAGLMDPELAVYINYVFDPRDKLGVTLTPKETHCKIVKKMLSLEEIGMGVKIGDLNLGTLNMQETCGLDSLNHAKGASYSKNVRAYIPVIGLFIVVGIYAFGFYYFGKKS